MIWALHGNLGDPADWDGVSHLLEAQGWEALNLWREGIEPFEIWAGHLNERAGLLDDEPVLAGYSMGARLAMHALCRDDAPWRAAVLIAGHPGLRDEGERVERVRSDRTWADRLRRDGWETFVDAWNAQPVFAGDPMPARQRMVARQYPKEVAAAFREWSLGRQDDLRERLRRSPVPQLWITGERDVRYGELAREAIAGNPRARHDVIPGGGHRLLLQKPLALAECVRAFLRTNLER